VGVAAALLHRRAPPTTPPTAPSATPIAAPVDETGNRLRRAFDRLVAAHPQEIYSYEERTRHLEEVVPWAVAASTRANWDFTWDYLLRYLEEDRRRPRPVPPTRRTSRDELMTAVLPTLLHLFEDIEQLEKNAQERLAGLSIERGPDRPVEELREMASLGKFVRDRCWRWLDGLADRAEGPSDLEMLVATWVTAETSWPGARWAIPWMARRPADGSLEAPEALMTKAERRLFYSQEIAGILGCQAYDPLLDRHEELATRPGSSRIDDELPWSVEGFLFSLRHFAQHRCREADDLARLERMLGRVKRALRIECTAAVRQRACEHLHKGNGHLELLDGDAAAGAEDILKRFRTLLADRCGPQREGG
jgi:hypothetical protein